MHTLTGVIERITFHNEENGYTVARLQPEQGETLITIIGNMLGIHVGAAVALRGVWTSHSQYGRQFKVEDFKTVLPATATGIEKYLGSGLIKGIGPVTAKRIVRRFGADTLRVIDEQPERLSEALGVGKKRVTMIQQAWAEQRQIKEVMIFLQAHGVSTALAVKIYKHYGNEAIGVLQTDPYRLQRDIYGIGFLTADKIAKALGIPHDSPERVAAGVAYLLSEQADEGHVFTPQPELTQGAGALLGVASPLVEEAITRLRQEEQVQVEAVRYQVQAALPSAALAETQAVYLAPFYYGEIGVAGQLRRLQEAGQRNASGLLAAFRGAAWDAAFAALARQMGMDLASAQRQAVQTALTHPVTVLTGGPGTGKTTTLRALIHLLHAAGKRFALAAPTGRAAKRMAEATGHEAKTIHRLLEVDPSSGFAFKRNAQQPLQLDMLIVDEASMLDLLLTNHLLKAIPPGAHLLLVGDVDQLPSVGAGNVLRDVIDSGEVAVVTLHTIFRQAAGSYIISNAHRINQGQMPLFPADAKDFYLFQMAEPERCADMVVELVQTRIPAKFGIPSAAIQVLSPMHRGAIGVAALNDRLQTALNPPRPARAERAFGGRVLRVGDRVMQTRNNYDLDVFNGDMGVIAGIDLEVQTLTVVIDGRNVVYDWANLDELVHAWAVSVHKSQGSEYRAVVIPFHTTHYVMLQRNLLYTAVTRARELVVIVGTRRALAAAVHNDKVAERHSALAERLQRGALSQGPGRWAE
ncbi:MAG: ATP-dependent RecD-like DNA helicase [Caldilineales bacterium]|nr:ATP-dependent RecD-like DNA helicase [Caldilineales bacterium]